MARKYARDNRGRFASSGSGATARGGRLKTASGNKRATQTMKAAGAGGVIKGRAARTVAGEKVMAKLAKRAPAAKRISAARPGGTVAKPKGLKPGAMTPKVGRNSKVPTNLPGLMSDRWKWNKGGTALATLSERKQQFNRERYREKKTILAPVVKAASVRSDRRALASTLSGRDSKQFSSTNEKARAALQRKSARASEVFKGQRPPKRMSAKAAAKLAKRRANSERVGRAAMAEYQRQAQYVEARTTRPRRY